MPSFLSGGHGGRFRVLAATLALCLGPLACKHKQAAPTSAPAPVDSASEQARATRFQSELSRAQKRWQEKPELGNCAEGLHEQADLDLCRSAANARHAVEALDPAAAPGAVLPVLSDGALALTRLLERARYLTFEEMSERRLEGDAGLAASTSTSAAARAPAAPAASAAPMNSLRAFRAFREHKVFRLNQSPLSHLLDNVARLERDVLRQFSAYLEYAPLSVRQASFDAAKKLVEEHPAWPTLTHTLREAAVLESDPDLKQKLSELAATTLPRGKRPAQATGSK
jgi:hypothetical protein